MILSASRRCDLPAFSMEWLAQRVRAGFVQTANPFNPKQTRMVSLHPDSVDGIVFWSKNPAPLLQYQTMLSPYPFYLQYTLNPYGSVIEPGVPLFSTRLETARRVADAFGPEALCPRYDPVLLSEKYPISWHMDAFEAVCIALNGHADEITVSFLDLYRKIEKTVREMGLRTPEPHERHILMRAFAQSASSHGMRMATCAEPGDYAAYGVLHGRCIDAKRLASIARRPIEALPDKNQRPHCGCAQSVDIGAYGKCAHRCVYCYAAK